MDLMRAFIILNAYALLLLLFENILKKAAQYLQSNFLLKYYGIVIVIATFHYDETFEIFVA